MNRFVAGEYFYNHDLAGGLRAGGDIRLFSRAYAGLVAAIFTSSFVYVDVRYGLLLMVSDELGLSDQQTEAMDRLVQVPAALAFFVGLYADAIPVFGYRRKSYMVIGMVFSLVCLAIIGLGCLFADYFLRSIPSSFKYGMMVLMGCVSFGSMINFCSVHTAVVTISQSETLDKRGVFQADYLIARATGQITARLLIYLIQSTIRRFQITLTLLTLMLLSMATIWVVLRALDEPPVNRIESLRYKCASYWKLTKQKVVWHILAFISGFAVFLNFEFPRVEDALQKWSNTTSNASSLLCSSLNDLFMIVTVFFWRCSFRNMRWSRMFAVAPTMTIVPRVLLALLVIPAFARYAAVYVLTDGLTGVATGIKALALLVPVTEITEEGSEGGVVGLVLSFDRIFNVFIDTLLTSIETAPSYPVGEGGSDTRNRRVNIAVLEIVTCCVNALAFVGLGFLPTQKLDAQLMRVCGGFTENAGAVTASAFALSLAYCVGYNCYVFAQAIHDD